MDLEIRLDYRTIKVPIEMAGIGRAKYFPTLMAMGTPQFSGLLGD